VINELRLRSRITVGGHGGSGLQVNAVHFVEEDVNSVHLAQRAHA
jgi:hypothetical protein